MNDNTCNSIKISDEEKENFPKMNDLYLSKKNKRNEFNKTSVHRNFNKLKIRNPGIDLIRLFCYWHNTSFIFISGMVGYKTCKYSNLLFLLLCVLLYSVGIHLFAIIFLPGFTINNNIIDNLISI